MRRIWDDFFAPEVGSTVVQESLQKFPFSALGPSVPSNTNQKETQTIPINVHEFPFFLGWKKYDQDRANTPAAI
jgi:hypothetical protein